MSHVDNYMRWITPTVGDPTYSLLKAHLLFEELLRSYLRRTLPHANALEGARLTFVQLLAVARASSAELPPDHWAWKAVGDLNKLRNMLSHEARPKDLSERMRSYTTFVTDHAEAPLPEPAFRIGEADLPRTGMPLYSASDMATIILYYRMAALLGFDVENMGEKENRDAGDPASESDSGTGHDAG